MNCRPGDLALIVRGHELNIGQAITCLRFIPPGTSVRIGPHNVVLSDKWGQYWLIDRPVLWEVDDFCGRMHLPALYAADCALLPIRPERDEDLEETEREARDREAIVLPVAGKIVIEVWGSGGAAP